MCSIGIALTPRPRRRQDALTPQQFNTRVYDVLLRYETLAQFDQGTQGTLPGPAFECLRDDWGVGHECFASPLNGPGRPARLSALSVSCSRSLLNGDFLCARSRAHARVDVVATGQWCPRSMARR